jgi:dephospho-CoA kinase
MIDVGLTGGIGSGKSTVARMLAEHGATVIDADALAREVLAPGTPGLAEVVAAFGVGVLRADGSLDRPALAALVFSDETAVARLEAIVHPAVARLTELRWAAAGDDAVVVHDVPLLVEKGLRGRYDLVVVVDAPEEMRLSRLAERGVPEADGRARMAAQAGRAERLAASDVVLVNDAGLAQLRAQVDALWARLDAQRRSGGAGPVRPTS